VTQDLDEPRGPDVACSIEVPQAWFLLGATLQITLPRLLSCARCDGGGCDACERRGAFEQQAAGIASEVAVVLPTQSAERCAAVRLRLPALGARAAEAELPSGHLLLTIVPHEPEPGWLPALTVQAFLPRPRRTLRYLLRTALPELLRARLRGLRLRGVQVRIGACLALLVFLTCFWLLRRSH
jgi:hypothetical protein